MDAKLRQHCQRRKAAMLQTRMPHEALWRQVAEYIDPLAGVYLQANNTAAANRQLPSRRRIINSEAARALRTMDAGFMGGHTSKSRPWFRLTVSDPALGEMADVKAWLDDVTQAIRDSLAKSNFYSVLPAFYHDRHLFGASSLACEEDEKEVVRFYKRPVGSYAVGLNRRGRINAFWYSFRQSASDIVDQWGPGGVPDTVRQAMAQGRPFQEFEIESLVEENPEKGGRPFRQIYWMSGSDSDPHGCLEITKGYEFPVLFGRWEVQGSDVYGSSPAIEALGDIKQLQYLESEKLRLIDLISKPPLAAPEHLRNKGASLTPGTMVYVTPLQTQQKVEPIYTPSHGALQQVMAEIAVVSERVRAAFYADLFRMLDFLDDRQRTAYEISERKEEKIAMLGPQLESLSDEVLDPVIERTYSILDRAGKLPPIPEALDSVEVRVEYTSMLAQAQKASGTGTIERVLGLAANLVSVTGDPSTMDKIDVDQVLDEVHAQQGAPARILRSDDDVRKMREGRAQQQQMAQAAAMAPAMKQGAEALKIAGEARAQQGSMLDSLSGAAAGA